MSTAVVQAYVYEHLIDVVEADIDGNGHVNNVVYVRWIQEATAAHWRASSTPDQSAAWAWMVLRHEIDYVKAAFAGDKVIARTWVGDDKGVRWERFVEIVRPADGAVLVRARSVWCALDRATLRPRRVDAAVRARFLNPPSE